MLGQSLCIGRAGGIAAIVKRDAISLDLDQRARMTKGEIVELARGMFQFLDRAGWMTSWSSQRYSQPWLPEMASPCIERPSSVSIWAMERPLTRARRP